MRPKTLLHDREYALKSREFVSLSFLHQRWLIRDTGNPLLRKSLFYQFQDYIELYSQTFPSDLPSRLSV